nr:MAG TPA: hypothetical protein [Caudoviricetes sp.]
MRNKNSITYRDMYKDLPIDVPYDVYKRILSEMGNIIL